MGQKINPHGFRVGVIKDWDTHWYADKKDFAEILVEDYFVREFIKSQIERDNLTRIEIEREGKDKVIVTLSTPKPGIIIGRQGAEIDALKQKLNKKFNRNFFINVKEIKNPDLDAQNVANNIADQLEDRVAFRRAMKQAIQNATKNGSKGIKIKCSGRLAGSEIARSEEYHEGSIPLHTLRADIDYGFAEADTQYGKIGVKVWIYKGEIFQLPKDQPEKDQSGEGEV